jgi:cytochrome b561
MHIFLTSVSLSVYNERLAIVLGLMTLISALAVFFSCRSGLFFLKRIGLSGLTGRRPFQVFIKYHTYYWWIFWIIFLIHLAAAIMHLGFKNSDDPDAYLHIYSVVFGLAAIFP